MAKAKSSSPSDSLDEQISSLLESVAADGKKAGSSRPSRLDEVLAHRRPGSSSPSDGSSSGSALRRLRSRTNEAPPRRKLPFAKKAAPRRKLPPAPAPKAAKTQRRPPATLRAHVRPPVGSRPRVHGQFLADPARRELMFFVAVGLTIGAVVGLLIALAG